MAARGGRRAKRGRRRGGAGPSLPNLDFDFDGMDDEDQLFGGGIAAEMLIMDGVLEAPQGWVPGDPLPASFHEKARKASGHPSKPAARNRRQEPQKPYCPKYQTAPYALLIALRFMELESGELGMAVAKEDLAKRAQPFATHQLIIKQHVNTNGDFKYDGFSCMGRLLLKKELAMRSVINKRPMFSLKATGRELADKLIKISSATPGGHSHPYVSEKSAGRPAAKADVARGAGLDNGCTPGVKHGLTERGLIVESPGAPSQQGTATATRRSSVPAPTHMSGSLPWGRLESRGGTKRAKMMCDMARGSDRNKTCSSFAPPPPVRQFRNIGAAGSSGGCHRRVPAPLPAAAPASKGDVISYRYEDVALDSKVQSIKEIMVDRAVHEIREALWNSNGDIGAAIAALKDDTATSEADGDKAPSSMGLMSRPVHNARAAAGSAGGCPRPTTRVPAAAAAIKFAASHHEDDNTEKFASESKIQEIKEIMLDCTNSEIHEALLNSSGDVGMAITALLENSGTKLPPPAAPEPAVATVPLSDNTRAARTLKGKGKSRDAPTVPSTVTPVAASSNRLGTNWKIDWGEEHRGPSSMLAWLSRLPGRQRMVDLFDLFLLCDTAEPPSLLQHLENEINTLEGRADWRKANIIRRSIRMERKKLEVGDFAWAWKLKDSALRELGLPVRDETRPCLVVDGLLERKCLDDLLQSVEGLSQRYITQKRRMQRCGLNRLMYLIEGEKEGGIIRKYTGEERTNTVNTVEAVTLLDGYAVFRTSDELGTARHLLSFSHNILMYEGLLPLDEWLHDERFQKVEQSEFIKRVSSLDPNTLRTIWGQGLVQLPQISAYSAAAIMTKFPTPRSLCMSMDTFNGCSSASRMIGRAQSQQMAISSIKLADGGKKGATQRIATTGARALVQIWA